jgi:hypothetical protein
MWHIDWKLESWFAEVERQRDKKYGTSGSSGASSTSDDDEWAPNEYADRFKR